MMQFLAGMRVLVTGASSGIGHALAVLAARRGARVMLVGRSAAPVQRIAQSLVAEGCRAVALRGDVTSAGDRHQMLDEVARQFGGLDILVNNAGILATGHFTDASADRLRQIMETNFFAAAELMRGAVPLLRHGCNPTIVNIASITGRRGVPARPEYSASKFALIGLSEAVRAELAKDAVNVLVVNPCLVNTRLEKNSIENSARREWSDRKLISPEFVADRTLRAILKRRHEITIGGSGRLLLLVNRMFPRFVDHLMARYVRRLYPETATATPAAHQFDEVASSSH
jgi:short-subunit dehydrogenase